MTSQSDKLTVAQLAQKIAVPLSNKHFITPSLGSTLSHMNTVHIPRLWDPF